MGKSGEREWGGAVGKGEEGADRVESEDGLGRVRRAKPDNAVCPDRRLERKVLSQRRQDLRKGVGGGGLVRYGGGLGGR